MKIVEAVEKIGEASNNLRETANGFDNLMPLGDWHGISHLDMIDFFYTVAEMLDAIHKQLTRDFGDNTAPQETSLNAAIGDGCRAVARAYSSVVGDDLTATNYSYLTDLFGDPDDDDSALSIHESAHNQLCETISAYPYILSYLNKAKRINQQRKPQGKDWIDEARAQMLRAQEAEKKLRLLRAKR
ncbi:hypothetical protein FRC0477_00732 [Corynebacterium diphtheriae]|nr:hypothetical protein FRC0477_00732 [Corynebacterium diphtheriae]